MSNELFQVSLTVNILAESPEEAKAKVLKTLARNGHVGQNVVCRRFQAAQSAFGLKTRQTGVEQNTNGAQ